MAAVGRSCPPHHWLLASPVDGAVEGRCKRCGLLDTFYEEHRRLAGANRGKTDAQLRDQMAAARAAERRRHEREGPTPAQRAALAKGPAAAAALIREFGPTQAHQESARRNLAKARSRGVTAAQRAAARRNLGNALEARRARAAWRYERVAELTAAGCSVAAIAADMGVSPQLVRLYRRGRGPGRAA